MRRVETVNSPIRMLERSALVVAHPDDEILWFSSVVKSVDHIVFCFLKIEGNPTISEGRLRVLRDFPLREISILGINEAGVFDLANWNDPKPTTAGLELARAPGESETKADYLRNYDQLRNRLRTLLKGYKNVITHNPWGEYGHEEHVQVHRAVKEAQSHLGFEVWVSNYCSNRSFRLMQSYVSGFRSDYLTIPIDRVFATEVRDLYRRHACWTWYDDFEWFKEESFICDKELKYREVGHGHLFPVNMIRMELPGNALSRAGRRWFGMAP
jgi:LmbE family N-acetylglucosaminyl deacetylase